MFVHVVRLTDFLFSCVISFNRLTNRQRKINTLKKIKKLNHRRNWACDAAEGIPVDNFATYVEDLQEKFSLPDKAKKSLLDILISKEKQGSPNEFTLPENEITMFSMEYIGVNQNQKINLAFAMYDLHFKVDADNETGAWSALVIL